MPHAKRATLRNPEADALAWASASHRKARCETCRWAHRNPDASRWLSTVLRLRREGKTAVSLDTVHAELKREFSYPLSPAALYNHERACLGGDRA